MGLRKVQSLRQKLGMAIGAGILLTVAILVFYSSMQTRREAIAAAEENVKAEASNFAADIRLILEDAMDASRAFANSLSVVGDPSFRGDLSREQVQAMGEQVLLSNNDFIGLTIAFEPNAFDGKDKAYVNTFAHDRTGRLMSYLTRNQSGGASIECLVGYENQADAPWYFKPKELKRDFLTEPVLYPIQGKEVLMISFMTPILHDGQFLGVTGIDYPIDFMQNLVLSKSLYNGNFDLSILSNEGVFAASNSHPEWVNQSVRVVRKDKAQAILTTIGEGKPQRLIDNDQLVVTQPLFVGNSGIPWQVQISVPLSEITNHADRLMWIQIVIGLILLIIGVSMVIWYVTRLIKPLEVMVGMVSDMAQGNLKRHVEVKTGNDEIGILYQAFSEMRNKLVEIINQIVDGSNQIATASEQLSNTSMQISQGAAEQASAAEEVSSTIEEMTANIQQNRANANESEVITQTVTGGVSKGAETAQLSVQAFNEIAQKILFIKDIAMQTNILALNASVEAARSGEHGRGFAVVASEVRKLAEHTSEASVLIDDLIERSKVVVEETGDIMQSIVPQVKDASRLVQEIAASSAEQASGAEQVNNAIQQLSHVIQQNAAASEEMASSSEELSSQAESLKTTISFFQV